MPAPSALPVSASRPTTFGLVREAEQGLYVDRHGDGEIIAAFEVQQRPGQECVPRQSWQLQHFLAVQAGDGARADAIMAQSLKIDERRAPKPRAFVYPR